MQWVAFMLCTAMLLTGCAGEPAEMTVPMQTAVTEDAAVPETETEQFYSQEMAMLDRCVVMQDGDVRHNVGSWYDFLEQCQTGKNAKITVVQYTSEGSGSSYVRYDLTFDGTDYTVSFVENGIASTESSQVLVIENGLCYDTAEPYDRYEAYLLNDIVLYKDLIAEPDYEGITEIFLHAKEGERALKVYTDPDAVDAILQLLMTADYIPVEPENYVYGMKLLMTNRDGKQLVIELDLNQGVYRYGMQNYEYGTVSGMLTALGLEQWPEAVLNEYSAFLKE